MKDFLINYVINEFFFYGVVVPTIIILVVTKVLNAIIKPQALCVLGQGLESMRDNWTFEEAFDYADANGCTPDLLMELESPVPEATTTIGIWRTPVDGTYFACYVAQENIIYEFMSTLTKGTSLDTNSSINNALFPSPPDCYRQTFDHQAPNELARHHAEGLAYLKQHFFLQPESRNISTDVLVQESLLEEIGHVKSIPLWPVRAVYWYFIRRRFMNNRTIAQQYPRG